MHALLSTLLGTLLSVSTVSTGRLHLVRQSVSFFRAEVYCETHGGHLASVQNEAENAAIHNLCDSVGKNCWLGMFIRDGAYAWTDSSPLHYTNWHPGEPDNWNGVEECAMMMSKYHDGTWSDQDCEATYSHSYFVCEFKDNDAATMETSTLAMKSSTSVGTTPPAALAYTGAWDPKKLKVDTDHAHFTLNGERVFLSGINQAWVAYCYDFGNQQYQYRRAAYEKTIQQMQQAGGNSIRIWVHCEGETSPSFRLDGYVNGTDNDNTFISDLREYIRYAAQHDILVFITLWNGAVKQNFHYRIDGLIQDTAKLQSYIDNALIPTVSALKSEPGLGGWDVINEFEGQLKTDVVSQEPCYDTTFLKNSGAGWAGHLYSAQQWLRFINYQVDAIRRTDPMAQVTAGAWSPNDATGQFGQRNLYSDECLMKAGGKSMGTLTFYSIHSYDWNKVYASNQPFKHNETDYQLDKPLVIAEFNEERGGGMTSPQQYQFLYNHGYAGGWAWSYTDETWNSMASGLSSIKDLNDQTKGGKVHFTV